MELRTRQFRWHEQFHGIPWNSMELGVRQFRWHEQFHGIPWNFGCANFADTSSSMEFHAWSAPISLTWEVTWNSMELWVRQFRWHEQFHGIPWNSMELEVRQFRWHEQFHGIPWNLEYANFNDTSSSMEFHGTGSAPISLTQSVPWNSMELRIRQFRWHEQFHGIPWNSMELRTRQFRWHEQFHGIPWNSVELGVRQFRRHEQFHGIPWNLECANFADTSSSMEFHGTWSAPISLTWAVPWNSMELRVRQFRWHEQFHSADVILKLILFIENVVYWFICQWKLYIRISQHCFMYRKRYLQMAWYLVYPMVPVCSEYICLGNDLVWNRKQAITWTNDDHFSWGEN